MLIYFLFYNKVQEKSMYYKKIKKQTAKESIFQAREGLENALPTGYFALRIKP